MKANLVYSSAEQKRRMASFEREVQKARKAWRAGYAYMILSFEEWLALTAPKKGTRP